MAIRLEAELKRLGWSKSELARRSHVNQTTAIDIVNGRRRPPADSRAIVRIAAAIGWLGDPADLLAEELQP